MDEHGLSIKDAWLAFNAVGVSVNYAEFEEYVIKKGLYEISRLARFIPETGLAKLTKTFGLSLNPRSLMRVYQSPEETLDRQSN